MKNIIVILGPTATGKSGLAIELALKYGAEIISADSRQVYKGLDIGTGKVTREEMKDVRHHLLDVVKPDERFSVTDWAKRAREIIDATPDSKPVIIVGGTGFYIDSLLYNESFPDVPHNEELQKSLVSKSPAELISILEEIDPDRAQEIDKSNSRRIIRAIEIAQALGSVPPITREQNPDWNILKIGIMPADEVIKQRIHDRLLARIDAGMVDESIRLHSSKPDGVRLSFERMDELGLEYRYLAELLQDKLSLDDFKKTLETKIWQYARRQKTWFKKDKSIHWLDSADFVKAVSIIENFLQKNSG